MAFRKRKRCNFRLFCIVILCVIWVCTWMISTSGTNINTITELDLPDEGNVQEYQWEQDNQGNVAITENDIGELEENYEGVQVLNPAQSEDIRGEDDDSDVHLDATLEEQESEALSYKREPFTGLSIEKQNEFECEKLMDGDASTIRTARKIMNSRKRQVVPLKAYTWILDCDSFKRERGYILDVHSKSERAFPLAFTIVAYRDVEQIERLLRAIYRPHNYYCLHFDSKSKQSDRDALNSVSSCFDNVFLVENPVNVTWGGFSVLEAELLCMKMLWRYKTWKYYINLTGKEFPLKTNLEIVEILKAMNGANVADGTSLRGGNKDLFRWTLAGSRPPHNIKLVKGSVHVAINRDFVDFCLHDDRSRDFQEWLKKTDIPDETLFASLNHNPHLGIAGSFLGGYEASPTKPLFIRYKKWQGDDNGGASVCRGKYVRGICVIGIGDLQTFRDHPGLFVNKLYIDFEYLALDCLEEVLLQRTFEQYENPTTIDVRFYLNIDQVKYQLRKKR